MRSATTDSPIDDLTYDLIAVIHHKAKAIEAYDKYVRDAVEDEDAREVLERIKRQDQEHVRVLKEILARRLDEDLGFADEYEGEDYALEEDEDYDEEARAEALDDAEIESESDASDTSADAPAPRRGESTRRQGA